jgi:CubicO group peptidase (beta-lactamase class C family)
VNYDYAIAATILERLSGERFDLYMGKEVFKRVGMGRTSYRREEMEEAVNDIAVLYRANEEK